MTLRVIFEPEDKRAICQIEHFHFEIGVDESSCSSSKAGRFVEAFADTVCLRVKFS